MKITILSLLLSFCFFSGAQTVSYTDVAVIINDNSQTSIDIGNYFQSARNIPSQNIIHVLSPTTENINSLEFEQMRAQIESHLISNGIADSINYLVTTKGVPLKVNGGCVLDTTNNSSCASVDSELALILGPLSNSIGLSGQVVNPVYADTSNFDRESAGIYLVTRLDGYSKDDVFRIIDRSAPNTGINKTSAKGIVDISNATGSDSAYFASLFLPSYDYLMNNSWNAELDLNPAPLTNQSNVFGYFGLGHGPLPSALFNYDWTSGAVGAMTMCNSANTFDDQTNPNNDFLIANLIEDGCTGALGHVDFIYYSQIWDAEVFLSRYLSTTHTYNLAESFYMAEKTLSWQTVVIGDPKASVVIDNLASLSEPEIKDLRIYPNPSNGNIKVRGSTLITSISVYDLRGVQVKSIDSLMSDSIVLDLNEVENGVYVIQVEMGNERFQERVVIHK